MSAVKSLHVVPGGMAGVRVTVRLGDRAGGIQLNDAMIQVKGTKSTENTPTGTAVRNFRISLLAYYKKAVCTEMHRLSHFILLISGVRLCALVSKTGLKVPYLKKYTTTKEIRAEVAA